jgi:hypothetical protein
MKKPIKQKVECYGVDKTMITSIDAKQISRMSQCWTK